MIGLRERGLTYEEIGAQVGLTKNGVFDICKRYREKGMAGLQTGPRGPAPGTGRFLTAAEEADIQRLICAGTPDDYGLPFALWSRAAVATLVEQRCGVRLAVRSMGTYLARWNFTPQKPLRRAYEQDADAVRTWLQRDYPAIAARARKEKAKIFWGDETGLRSDDVRGRSYAPRGKTPVVRPNHRRANVGVISAVTNKGELRWMVLDGAINAPLLIDFLERYPSLARQQDRQRHPRWHQQLGPGRKGQGSRLPLLPQPARDDIPHRRQARTRPTHMKQRGAKMDGLPDRHG